MPFFITYSYWFNDKVSEKNDMIKKYEEQTSKPLGTKNVFHLDLGCNCNPQSHEMDSYASEAVFLVLLVTTPIT